MGSASFEDMLPASVAWRQKSNDVMEDMVGLIN
jgi:hypothetical protein